jgi:hypothetical protein
MQKTYRFPARCHETQTCHSGRSSQFDIGLRDCAARTLEPALLFRQAWTLLPHSLQVRRAHPHPMRRHPNLERLFLSCLWSAFGNVRHHLENPVRKI